MNPVDRLVTFVSADSSALLLLLVPAFVAAGTLAGCRGACVTRFADTGSYDCGSESEMVCQNNYCTEYRDWCAYYPGTSCEDLGLVDNTTRTGAEDSPWAFSNDWTPPSSPEPAWESTGDGTGGGTAACGTYHDGGIDDVQIQSQCQAAYAYSCQGNTEGIDATCNVLAGWGSQWKAKCPYCS